MSAGSDRDSPGHGVDRELIAAWRRRRAPAGLEARVQAALDERAPMRARPWLRPVVAAAAACLLAVAGLWLHEQGASRGPRLAGSPPGPAVDLRLAGPPSLSGLGPMPTASSRPSLARGPLPSLLDLPVVDLSPRREPSQASSPKEDS